MSLIFIFSYKDNAAFHFADSALKLTFLIPPSVVIYQIVILSLIEVDLIGVS